jgi:hypothetical protein
VSGAAAPVPLAAFEEPREVLLLRAILAEGTSFAAEDTRRWLINLTSQLKVGRISDGDVGVIYEEKTGTNLRQIRDRGGHKSQKRACRAHI